MSMSEAIETSSFTAKPATKRVLSVFALVMINVVAVDSLRTLPFSAKFGSTLIFYYLVCAVIFFFPVALVTAELATAWPEKGGIYVWVRKAFGDKYGFLVIWLQWVYNVVWYPTALSLIAGVAAFLIAPELTENPTYMVSVVLAVFWVATLLNCFSMKLSSWVSSVGSLLGTLLPMLGIAILGIVWIMLGHDIQIALTWDAIIPKVNSAHDLALVTTILFGLMGLEMSAVHASEVKDPVRDYPKALKISSVIILLSLLLSSFAVAIVVPEQELNIVTGMVQAFQYFFAAFDMLWMLPVIAVAIIIGTLGGIATWIIGPTKGLLAAAQDDHLPAFFAKTNSRGVPVNILLLQAVIVSVLSLVYILLPTIESAYLILTELTAILAMLMYVLMFMAAVKLRYKYPEQKRAYRIPGGTWGMWLVALLGGGTCCAALVLGFLPPSQIEIENSVVYQLLLALGVVVFCLPAMLIHKIKKK